MNYPELRAPMRFMFAIVSLFLITPISYRPAYPRRLGRQGCRSRGRRGV